MEVSGSQPSVGCVLARLASMGTELPIVQQYRRCQAVNGTTIAIPAMKPKSHSPRGSHHHKQPDNSQMSLHLYAALSKHVHTYVYLPVCVCVCAQTFPTCIGNNNTHTAMYDCMVTWCRSESCRNAWYVILGRSHSGTARQGLKTNHKQRHMSRFSHLATAFSYG